MNLATADRLILATGPQAYQYQIDPADNLLAQAGAQGTVNTLNQLLTWDGKDLIHNAAGNLTQDNKWKYRYDAQQRLVALKDKYDFRYDGLGRRTREAGSQDPTRLLLWCGEVICQVRSSSNVPTAYHYPQGELRGSQRLYYARDHLGSVREVRDLTTGLTPAAFDYTPYGAIRAQSGSLTPDYGFAGLWRSSSGLYLTHYRAYSPTYGRWMSRDPIHEAGGVNLYAYVLGNPIQYVDPSGLDVTINIENRTYSPTGNSVAGTISVTSDRIPNSFSGYTMENAHAGDNGNKSPIPPGAYPATVRRGRTPNRVELQGVPGYQNIQIHNGNYPRNFKGCFGAGTSQSIDFLGGTKDAMSQINRIVNADGSRNITVNVGPIQ